MRMVLGLAAVLGLVPGHLGSGDSVQARNTESVITSVVPDPPEGVRIDVVGSDTYVRVRAMGHSVEIPGYSDEPYVRIDADGAVWVNDGSTTAVLNGDRYGNVDLSGFTPSATPEWRRIGEDGTAMWHDHRSHWMSPKPPAPIDGKGTVQTFSIPMVIDGTETIVSGTLYLRDMAGIWWWMFGLAGLAVMVVVSIAREKWMASFVALFAVGGTAVGWAEFVGLPSGARITPVLLSFAAGAAVLSVVAAAATHRGSRHVSLSLLAGAGVALVTGVWLVNEQVRAAYVPGLSAPWMARAMLPMLLGAGIVATVHGVTKIFRDGPESA